MKSSRNLLRSALLIVLAFDSSSAFSAEWIEEAGDIKVNWSSLTARFSGGAISSPADKDGLKGLERSAWRHGYEKVGSQLERILREQFSFAAAGGKSAEISEISVAVEEVRKTIKSRNVTFFANGAVEVAMEAALNSGMSAVLKQAGTGRRTLPAGNHESLATGVVIKLPPAVRPAVVFWLVDANGNVLFEPAMASPNALSQGSMGRWFKAPNTGEIAKFVGEKPDVLVVSEVRDGNRFVVDARQFAELGAPALRALADGKSVLTAR